MVVATVLFLVIVGIVWEAFKWLAGDPWRLPAIGYVHKPPFHLLQASDLQLPHLWDIAAALLGPVQRNQHQSPGSVPARRRVLHLVGGAPGVHGRHHHGHPAGRGLRPFPGHRARLRALCHRHPDHPHRGARAHHRGQRRPGHCVGGAHRRLPDVLPGDHRRDARSPVARPACAGADALVRREPLDDDVEGPLPRVRALSVHGAQGRRHGERRGHHHRRGSGRHGRGPRPGDRQLQPAVHLGSREAMGDDPHRRAASASSPISWYVSWRSSWSVGTSGRGHEPGVLRRPGGGDARRRRQRCGCRAPG